MTTQPLFERPSNVTSITDFAVNYPNTVTNQAFAPFIMVAVFVIVFLNLRQRSSTESAFAAAAFLNFFVALIFQVVGAVSETVLVLSIVLLLVGAMFVGSGDRLG